MKNINADTIKKMWRDAQSAAQIINRSLESGVKPERIVAAMASVFNVSFEHICNLRQPSDFVLSELTSEFLITRFEYFAQQRPSKLCFETSRRRQMPHSMNSELDAEFIQNTLRETRAMDLTSALRVMVDRGFSASQISLEIQLRDDGMIRKIVAVKDLGFSLKDARWFIERGDRALSDDEVIKFDSLFAAVRARHSG